MKKIYLLIPRGLKNSTVFALSKQKSIDLKSLYKALTNPKNYATLFAGEVVINTKGETFDVKITNFISVDNGICKIRTEMETSNGKRKFTIEHKLDVTNPDIMLKDVNAIIDKFVGEVTKHIPENLKVAAQEEKLVAVAEG